MRPTSLAAFFVLFALLVPSGSLAAAVAEPDEKTETIYTLVKGDSLRSVAKRFDTTVEVIMQRNEITDRYAPIPLGTELVVPKNKDPDVAALDRQKEKRNQQLKAAYAAGVMGYDGEMIKNQAAKTLDKVDDQQRKAIEMMHEMDGDAKEP